jgi:hypothetical protein
MRRKVVAQVSRSTQAAIGAGLAQFCDGCDELVNLRLLPDDHFVELVNQIFGIAGFDFQLGQATVGVLFGFDSRLPCIAYYTAKLL